MIIETFKEFHLIFTLPLFFLPIHNLYWLYTEKNFIKMAKKIRLFVPIHYTILSSSIFSGIILAFYSHNFFSTRQLFMYLIALYLLLSEIKRYKKIRVITSKEIEEQQKFISWAKKKYILDCLILGVSIAIFVYS